jgi:hypothetical protein
VHRRGFAMITTIRWVLRAAVLFALLTSCSSPLDDVAPSCNNTDTTVSCCLKQYPGQLDRCGAEGPPRPHMLGERGTRLDSKTLWRGERGARLDVENPAPGRRPGQIHYQIDDKKYFYDPATKSFRDAPRAVQDLLDDPRFKDAIQKALRYLGET